MKSDNGFLVEVQTDDIICHKIIKWVARQNFGMVTINLSIEKK